MGTGTKEEHEKEEAKRKSSKSSPAKKNSTSKLTQWINSKLDEKGVTASAAKKNAGKYKSISAAKKAGSLYYTNPKGSVMIAAFSSDLDSVQKKKKKPIDSKEVGKQRDDMRRSAERAADAKKMIKINEPKGGGQLTKTVEVKAKTDMSDKQKRSSGVSGLNLSTIADIKNVLPELRNILSKKDMKALENILSGKIPMSKDAQIREIKQRVKKVMGFNVGGLTQSAMQNGLSRKVNPTTGLTMNKGGMTDYRKKGMFYGGGMARRGR